MKLASGSGSCSSFSSAAATAVGSNDHSSCSSARFKLIKIAFHRITLSHPSALATARNFEPSMATDSPRTSPTYERKPPTPSPLRHRLHYASVGTRRSTCNPAADAPAATSVPRCDGTRLPTAATSAPGAGSRTGRTSADHVDRSPAVPYQPAPLARNPTRQGKSTDEGLNHPTKMIGRNQIVQRQWKHRELPPPLALNEAMQNAPTLVRPIFSLLAGLA